MSHNDVLHLEAHFSNWKESRGAGLSDVDPFLYYSLDQILKPYNLEDEEIRYGIIDKGNDGGVDALYIFANHKTLIRDDVDIKSSGTSQMHIVLVQVKSSLSETGFKLEDVRKFQSFIGDLLDLGTPADSYNHKYHQHLITLINTFKSQYKSIMANFPELSVHIHLVTRGDETELDQATKDEVDKLIGQVKSQISHSTCTFLPTNTQALLEHVRKRKQTIRAIKWASPPVQTTDGYVGLVRLEDFFTFLKDEDGELNEAIFESNVRGFQGLTSVNNAMAETLKARGPLNFWLLNNGITIISSGRVQPVNLNEINIEDPQIVNGLQTSRKIFDHMVGQKSDPTDDRAVLVKILPVSDAEQRRNIIRATNNQNPMNAAALLATDDVHYQIEDLFKQHDLFYDRRPGFYRDQGFPAAKIVSVTELVQAVVALVEVRPDTARARPSDYINKDPGYKKIFGRNRLPLGVYYKAITIIRAVERFLRRRRVDSGNERNYKYYVAYVLCVRQTGKLYPSTDDIQNIQLSALTDDVIQDALFWVNRRYGELVEHEPPDSVAKGPTLLQVIKNDLAKDYDDSPAPKSTPKKLKPRDVLKQLERL